MSLSSPRVALLAASALLFAFSCKSGKPDSSRVIANVGGEKITEAEFQDVVKTISPDAKEAATFLVDPARRDERAQLANNFAMSRAIIAYAKQTGLDQQPAVKRQLEQAQASIFFQTLAKQRVSPVEPTDDQLRAFYNEQVAKMKAMGQAQGIPPFETVKAQLAQGWKQKRMAEVSQDIQKEIKTKVKITLADDYRPAGE